MSKLSNISPRLQAAVVATVLSIYSVSISAESPQKKNEPELCAPPGLLSFFQTTESPRQAQCHNMDIEQSRNVLEARYHETNLTDEEFRSDLPTLDTKLDITELGNQTNSAVETTTNNRGNTEISLPTIRGYSTINQ